MVSFVSQSNQDYIDENWGSLKCSPIGPFLQSMGIAPGDPNETSQACKSSEFNSQFSSNMAGTNQATSGLTSGLNAVTGQITNIKKVLAGIQQQAFKDLSSVANKIFDLYVKLGSILFIMIKHIVNILKIFKSSVKLGSAVTKLLLSFINLLRVPLNAVFSLFGRN